MVRHIVWIGRKFCPPPAPELARRLQTMWPWLEPPVFVSIAMFDPFDALKLGSAKLECQRFGDNVPTLQNARESCANFRRGQTGLPFIWSREMQCQIRSPGGFDAASARL